MAVEVLSHGIAGAKAIGREDSRQMRLQRLTQALEGLQATASRPGDPGSVQRLWVRSVAASLVDVLETLLHAPGPSRLQSGALQPVHVVNLISRPILR